MTEPNEEKCPRCGTTGSPFSGYRSGYCGRCGLCPAREPVDNFKIEIQANISSSITAPTLKDLIANGWSTASMIQPPSAFISSATATQNPPYTSAYTNSGQVAFEDVRFTGSKKKKSKLGRSIDAEWKPQILEE